MKIIQINNGFNGLTGKFTLLEFVVSTVALIVTKFPNGMNGIDEGSKGAKNGTPPPIKHYVGATVFMDHVSGFTHVHLMTRTRATAVTLLRGGAGNNINMSILVCLIRCDTISTFFRTKKVFLYC